MFSLSWFSLLSSMLVLSLSLAESDLTHYQQLNEVNMISDVTKIEIESEGNVNGFFSIHYNDGSVRTGWSCDQGSIEVDDEGELDDDLHNLCMDQWFAMDIDPEDMNHRWCATWTKDNGLGATTSEEVD